MKSKSHIIYKDIIDLPYKKNYSRKIMTMVDRAAQFAPFAALNGHAEAVDERARTTTYKIELDEYRARKINDKLNFILENIKYKPNIKIVYFEKDDKKAGGRYITKIQRVIKINEIYKYILTENNLMIEFEDIFDIEIKNEF